MTRSSAPRGVEAQTQTTVAKTKLLRCAIYTRKSTEEGLQQEFNSLDAQREAAEAFIVSQKNEGWRVVKDHFDDGGYTGGNMDRPALQRLLKAAQEHAIDCVVVYKVDRLSRSLLDFARMMEIFERHGVSFVSVSFATAIASWDVAASHGALYDNGGVLSHVDWSLHNAASRDHCGGVEERRGRQCDKLPRVVQRTVSIGGAFAIVLITFAPLFALDPSLTLSQYQKRQWQVEDGLPHNYVTAVLQRADGYLLVATDDGLVRFDGSHFSPLEGGALARGWLVDAKLDGHGGVWGAFWGGMVQHIVDGRVVDEWHGGSSSQALFIDSRGVVWTDSNTGIERHDGRTVSRVPCHRDNKGDSWSVFAEDEAGDVWILTDSTLFRYHNGAIATIARWPGRQTLTLHYSGAGLFLVGTSDGLYTVDTHGPAAMRRVDGVAGPVSALLRDRDGVLWVGTWGRGLYRVGERGVDRWATHNGLADDFVRCLFEDDEGNLWIGTRSGGLMRWKAGLVTPYGIAEGMAGNFASAVTADGAGNVWVGTYRSGLYRIDAHGVSRQAMPHRDGEMLIRTLAVDGRGGLWVGGWNGFFHLARAGGEWKALAPLPGAMVIAVSDGDAGVWAGTERGVWHVERNADGRMRTTPILESTPVSTLLVARDGALWIASGERLFRLEHGRTQAEAVGNAGADICALAEDSRHRIWATITDGRLLLATRPKLISFDGTNGLSGDPIYAWIDDARGRFWMSTRRGLLYVYADEMEHLLAGRVRRLHPVALDTSDGMRSIECQGISRQTGVLDVAGRLWFATTQGLAQLDPARFRRLPTPRVLFESLPLGELRDGVLRIAASTREWQARFTALRFSSPGHVRFRTKLEGFDANWSASTTSRDVRYTSLAPGRYRLLVEARDAGGDWSAPTVLRLEQRPRFYQTWWFALLGTLAVGGAIYAVYRWRLIAVRGHYDAVLAERNRIAREWHDTLLAGLSGISWQLQAALHTLRRAPTDAEREVELAHRLADHCQSEARRVIWDLREAPAERADLASELARYTERLASTVNVRIEVAHSGAPVLLPLETERHAFRVGQEAIANAVRHSGASVIRVHVTYDDKMARLRIVDDGRGFDTQQARALGHFGLLGMEERVLSCGGRFELRSAPGTGTTVEAAFPLAKERV